MEVDGGHIRVEGDGSAYERDAGSGKARAGVEVIAREACQEISHKARASVKDSRTRALEETERTVLHVNHSAVVEDRADLTYAVPRRLPKQACVVNDDWRIAYEHGVVGVQLNEAARKVIDDRGRRIGRADVAKRPNDRA